MNSASQLHERLLKLFPVKVVKGQFEVEATIQAEMLPEIAAKYSADSIKAFLVDNIGLTRQHNYFFRLGSKFNRGNFDIDALPMQVISSLQQDDSYIFWCLPVVEYDLALFPPGEQFTMQLYQPTRIVVNRKDVVIQATILERSASSYMEVPKQQKLIEIQRRNTEDVFIQDILAVFRQSNTISVCDLNQGVKALWNGNSIDATSVSYRGDKSMTTKAMDEQCTVKQDLPEDFKDIITRPLSRTIFQPISDKDQFSRKFTVDPSKGILRTSTYPEHPDQTWNIINEILRNN
ncbi:hypothetical protein [Hymenobacter sp. YC55]|uniref:hypothetical protein n=1 Tax=Hymenobacter sp. YC55 TaxID=3034019 RepID=UPI0023F9D5F3|nr:hypothetical protein [Hymenobacter sp. YC55]MDF7813590.1 hypothetical protein [Hymenobacter sp. YC55]